ncbi:hypothetical protein [Patulibacter sp.]|uniref:hypothetical protein n=1 Tax=Patulibacter sp. TaxID=1912859 RepID=UPI00271819B5|nr:hypothetical protein [Patulibacter sp.]MDO9409228.1 hypothetical protein [Patulibacter sp.]
MVDPPPLLRPVEGPVVSRFSYDRATPFRSGRRRIVRFRVPPGAVVRAPCRGRVTHAGRVPGGGGVTLRCGGWSVTLTGVDAQATRGRRAARGTTIARAGASPVGLGLRRTADPFGYVDPLPLLRAPEPAEPFVPLGPAPRVRPVAPVPAPAARPLPVPAVLRVPVAPGAPAPVSAWVGLGVAALGLPAGAVGLRVRRRRVRGRAVVAGRADA